MKLRVIIVDDERIARQRLRRMLSEYPDVEVVAECANGAAAVKAVEEEAPNLLLLDIQMPGMDGFDVVTALPSKRLPIIVFVTGYDQHAIRAFEACALDYLLKPTSSERLAKTLARVREHLTLPSVTQSRRPESSVAGSFSRRFSVRSGQRTSFISPNQIDWIEADGNYAILHVGNQNHLLRETMCALETQLPSEKFLRVSRSAILNLRRVKNLRTGVGGQHFAVLTDGQRVLMTRSVREIERHLRASQFSPQ